MNKQPRINATGRESEKNKRTIRKNSLRHGRFAFTRENPRLSFKMNQYQSKALGEVFES